MLDECTVRAVRKIRRPNIHDGRLLITYSINLVELGNVHEACMVSLVHGCMVSLVHGACMVSLVTGMGRVWSSMEVSKRSVNRGYYVYKVGLDDLPWV